MRALKYLVAIITWRLYGSINIGMPKPKLTSAAVLGKELREGRLKNPKPLFDVTCESIRVMYYKKQVIGMLCTGKKNAILWQYCPEMYRVWRRRGWRGGRRAPQQHQGISGAIIVIKLSDRCRDKSRIPPNSARICVEASYTLKALKNQNSNL